MLHITLPDGSKRWSQLAGAATASHDVNNAYRGTPIDENGQSVNDRITSVMKMHQISRSIADNHDSKGVVIRYCCDNNGITLR